VISATDGTRVQSVYYSANITASASDAVTAVWSGNAMYCEIRIAQYSGLAKTSPVDKAVHTTGNTSSQSIGPINTTHAHDLLFAAIVGSSTMPGAGYSQRISFVGDFVEDRVVTTTGSFLATASGTATNWVGQLVAFKGAN